MEKQLESAFDLEGGPPKVPGKLALGGAAIGFGVILIGVVVLVAIVFLVKTVFF